MTPEQITKARSFATSGYCVEPTINGGFNLIRRGRETGIRNEDVAAFTNAEDLLKYLGKAHEQDGHEFVVSWLPS